jgi:hypothetical protein
MKKAIIFLVGFITTVLTATSLVYAQPDINSLTTEVAVNTVVINPTKNIIAFFINTQIRKIYFFLAQNQFFPSQ